MIRRFYIFPAIFMAIVMVGCSSIRKSIVAKQDWSENYAAAEGVEATAAEMVDGDMSTIGETQSPTDARGSTDFSEAVVKLPEKKSIRRIVLYTPNIQSYSIYAANEDGISWEPLQEIKNNDDKKIDMSVSAVTDKIRIRVRKTSDDELLPGGRGRGRQRVRHAKGKIKEIEIYGLVEASSAQLAEAAEQPTATAAADTSNISAQAAEQAIVPSAPGTPSVPAQEAVKPKGPPAVLGLESPQNTYTTAGPIPVKINLQIGPDELVVLKDYVSDEMLCTKLLVKTTSGEKIPCSKPTPSLSRPRMRPTSEGPAQVREARTLAANSVITVDIPDLLEYYPMKDPGKYTVQLDMKLTTYDRFIDKIQTEIEDLEMTIRGVNAKTTYSQTERASIVQGLREDIEQLEKRERDRYVVVGTMGKSLDLSSNILELIVQ